MDKIVPGALQKYSTSQCFGGNGGEYFKIIFTQNECQVIGLKVRSGIYLDSITLISIDKKECLLESKTLGGEGGQQKKWIAPFGEHINRIEVRAHDYVDCIKFCSKSSASDNFGGEGGSLHVIQLQENERIVGIQGRAGIYIDQIGFFIKKIDLDLMNPQLNRLSTEVVLKSANQVQDNTKQTLKMNLSKPITQIIQNLNLQIKHQVVQNSKKEIKEFFQNHKTQNAAIKINNVTETIICSKLKNQKINKIKDKKLQVLETIDIMKSKDKIFFESPQIKKITQQLKYMVKNLKIDKLQENSSVQIKQMINKNQMTVNIDAENIKVKLKDQYKHLKYIQMNVQTYNGLKCGDPSEALISISIKKEEFIKETLATLEKIKSINQQIERDIVEDEQIINSSLDLQQKIQYLVDRLLKFEKEKISGMNEDTQLKFIQFSKIDLVIVIDTTGSMDQYLDKVKKSSVQIIEKFQEQYPKHRHDIQFGFVSYKDYFDISEKDQFISQKQYEKQSKVCEFVELTHDVEKVQQAIKSLQAGGGIDKHEAVHEGLQTVVTKFKKFRDRSAKVVILICDSPPHGKQYQNDKFQPDYDRFPNGHAQYSLKNISKMYNLKRINLYVKTIYPKPSVSSQKSIKDLKLMCKIFSQHFSRFRSQQMLSAQSYTDQIVNSISDATTKFQKELRQIQQWLLDLIKKTQQKITESVKQYLFLQGDQNLKKQAVEEFEKMQQKLKQYQVQIQKKNVMLNKILQLQEAKKTKDEIISQICKTEGTTIEEANSIVSSRIK